MWQFAIVFPRVPKDSNYFIINIYWTKHRSPTVEIIMILKIIFKMGLWHVIQQKKNKKIKCVIYTGSIKLLFILYDFNHILYMYI